MNTLKRNIPIILLLAFIMNIKCMQAQHGNVLRYILHDVQYPLYPERISDFHRINSPAISDNNIEVILACLKDSSFALIPVTVENGSPLLYSKRITSLYGKDKQLEINSVDFPALTRSGLHNEIQLSHKRKITGYPVNMINFIARPGQLSYSGFIAEDEDILSVLNSDNDMVKKMQLTHPEMAKPLFHIWNIILNEIKQGMWRRSWDNIRYILYNGLRIKLKAVETKGWQVSIFQDEIQGRFDISVQRDLSPEEDKWLKDQYKYLTESQMQKMITKLSTIHFSEMVPYYIMRYGFYEGHTDYRADPIAIAFIFGLRNPDEIDSTFNHDLHSKLTDHFISE